MFWNPRFIRGAGAAGVTAATLDGPQARLVLLRGRNAPLQLLPSIGRGRLRSGLLLRHEGGYWLLTLSAPPAAKAPPRRDAGGAWLLAGQLAAIALDDQLKPAGPEQAPFGDLPVYEFDADATAGTVGMVATAEQACVATRGRTETGRLHKRWLVASIPARRCRPMATASSSRQCNSPALRRPSPFGRAACRRSRAGPWAPGVTNEPSVLGQRSYRAPLQSPPWHRPSFATTHSGFFLSRGGEDSRRLPTRKARRNSGSCPRSTWPRTSARRRRRYGQAQAVVEAHIEEIEDARNRHFGG